MNDVLRRTLRTHKVVSRFAAQQRKEVAPEAASTLVWS